jgi:dimethylargininase
MQALVHQPSPSLVRAVRTFLPEEAIDLALALSQHAAYCRLLESLGVQVQVVNVSPDLPDSVFIEDTAVVLDEVAILASLGAASRAAEVAAIAPVLREYRPLQRIEPPATLEGGDVLRIGRQLLVGQSCRTNAAGIEQLAAIARRYGYQALAVPVSQCLHLKTACTALPDGRLLVNPAWIDVVALNTRDFISVPADEPWAANILPLSGRVILPAAHPRTAELLAGLDYDVCPIDLSEFAKAEGGITCLSLIFQP